jgi:hypothetical protein
LEKKTMEADISTWPEARTLIATMKSERGKDGERRFSEKTIVEYFRVLRKVIASALDGNFNPVHHRSWNLAAIGLPRVNPKKQRRPTFTAKEMNDITLQGRRSVSSDLFLLHGNGVARVGGRRHRNRQAHRIRLLDRSRSAARRRGQVASRNI